MRMTKKRTLHFLAAALFITAAIGGNVYAHDAEIDADDSVEIEAAQVIEEVGTTLSDEVRGQLDFPEREGVKVIEKTFHASHKSSSITRCFRRCKEDVRPAVNDFVQGLKKSGYVLAEEPEFNFDYDWGFSWPKLYCRVTLSLRVKVFKP